MRIDLLRLNCAGEDFEGELPASALDLGDNSVRIESGLRYALHAQLVSGELIVRGRLAVEVAFQCCRCAEFFSRAVKDDAFLVARDAPENEESVDLTPDMREAILLAFPSFPVCGSDCAGLCARCGKNLNRGPCECQPTGDGRWGVLDAWDGKRGGGRNAAV